MSHVNIYLKLKLAKGGLVKGPAIAQGHTDEMLLDTIRWGAENSAAVGGKGGSVSVRTFEFTKKMCQGSIQLLLACVGSDPVQEAVISCRATNVKENVDFLKWTLTDGVISLYETEAPGKDSAAPSERMLIRFRTLAVEFKPRHPDGTLGPTVSARLDVGASTASV